MLCEGTSMVIFHSFIQVCLLCVYRHHASSYLCDNMMIDTLQNSMT